MRLYLWKIERTDTVDYDEYSAAVVVAKTEAEARMIHPGNHGGYSWYEMTEEGGGTSWPRKPEELKVTKLGTAAPGLTAGTVVVASFRAG